jgi:hypothetical protein
MVLRKDNISITCVLRRKKFIPDDPDKINDPDIINVPIEDVEFDVMADSIDWPVLPDLRR